MYNQIQITRSMKFLKSLFHDLPLILEFMIQSAGTIFGRLVLSQYTVRHIFINQSEPLLQQDKLFRMNAIGFFSNQNFPSNLKIILNVLISKIIVNTGKYRYINPAVYIKIGRTIKAENT